MLRVGDAIDFAELLILSAFVAAAVSAVSLVIGAFARTRDQATWAAVVFTMFMTVFGGTFFDVSKPARWNSYPGSPSTATRSTPWRPSCRRAKALPIRVSKWR